MTQQRFAWMAGFVLLMIGLMTGAILGSFAGFVLADRWEQPAEAVTVAQPAPQAPLSLPEPVIKEERPAPAPQPTAPLPEGSDPVVVAVQRIQPATVRVLSNSGSSGSGVIIAEEGYIVTNNHVVEGGREFAVDLSRGERIPATLVGTAPEFDLAVLKIEGDVPAVAPWGDSSALPLGGRVIAIGSALGEYQNSVTIGILSGFNRSLGNIDGLLQTDAAINHGNSGGPLLNEQGEVVGINTMVVRGGQANAEGLGFAIPSNIARGIARQLIETGRAERPLMGVTLLQLNSQVAQELGTTVDEGAYIQEVSRTSPSAEAGIAAGDVIIAVNGKRVTDRDNLQMQVLSYMPGDTITLTILRGEQEIDLDVTLTGATRLRG